MPRPQRLAQTLRFYGRIGDGGWRKSGYFTFSASFAALRRWIASRLPAKGARILSIGCGAGELESHLTKMGHRVVGLDMSQQMLMRARDRGLKSLVRADSHALPFDAGSFDVVMFVECVGYLRMAAAFKEAWRVLGHHGRVLLITYSGQVEVHAAYTKFRMPQIASSLATAGFRAEKHRFLHAGRTSIVEVPQERASSLLCVWSTKRDGPHAGNP
jgi:ubiquinone/menaquinone biosynthesis C-methylase UbiE